MNDRPGARLNHHIQPITKREKCIRSNHRAVQREPGILCLDRGNASAVHPAHLSCAHAQCLAVGTKHDGIGFDEFRHAPREQQILQLLRCGLHFGHHFQLSRSDIEIIRGLYQQSAAHALKVQCIAACLQRQGQYAHVGFLGENLFCFIGYFRRNHHLDELLDHRLNRSAIQHAVESDDAAESRSRISGKRQLIGGKRRSGHSHAARIGVLDDDTSGQIERLDAFPRRVRIGDVVI